MKYHIEDLKDQLHNHNWIVLKESEGNDLDISEYWTIRHRYQPNKTCTLAFEGMDDLEVLPIEKSYACFLSEEPAISLYFSKSIKLWKRDLNTFILNLNSFYNLLILNPSNYIKLIKIQIIVNVSSKRRLDQDPTKYQGCLK